MNGTSSIGAMEGELTTKLHRKHSEKILNGGGKTKVNLQQCEPERKFQWGKGLKKNLDLSGQFIKTVSELPESCTNRNVEASDIQTFFKDCDVLITGATGFMGKILVEKLLVSCPTIGNLYLVIREKQGKSFKERFDTLFKDDVFIRLHKLVPDFRNKVIAVGGDCSRPNLGLSEADYEMLTSRVSIIFHGAATVRFDEKLKLAANINVRGVIEMLKFSRQCKSLKSLMHVSTAYANCTVLDSEITEEFYPAAYDYKKLIEMVDKESDEAMEKVTKDLIKPWPNTYAFTKQIGEDVIQKEGRGLPMGVFRPAIVIATYKEPIRGWSDNIYGPTGVIVGAGTGVLRVIQSDTNNIANMVPVDMAVNGLVAAAWKVHENFKAGNKNIEIYNYVSSARNPVRWGEYSYWNGVYGQNWPTVLAIWYSSFTQIRNRMLFVILAFLLHTLPSYVIDALCIVCRKEPKMRKIYKKIAKFSEVMSYFSTKEWTFTDENTVKLWRSLSAKDQDIYPFDIEEMDWDYHAQAHLLGLRVYLVKDDIDTLPKGRRKWRRLHLMHRALQAILIVVFSWVLFKLYTAVQVA